MSLLSPDRYYSSIYAIDVEELRNAGIRGLLVDLDNTLLPRDDDTIPPALPQWVAKVREAGCDICMVSNNWHDRVFRISGALNICFVSKALKPLPFAFWRARTKLGLGRDEVAVVGDQIFTDVLGGGLAGALTVLVQPFSPSDLPHTLLLRRIERRLLAGREPLD